jgi:hypothetical protein
MAIRAAQSLGRLCLHHVNGGCGANCCNQAIVLICRRSAAAFRLRLLKDTRRAESKAFRQIWMGFTKRPKVFSRSPSRNFCVDERASRNTMPAFHFPDEQMVTDFFSCVHRFSGEKC